MIGNFTEVKPLCYWVQHILPLVYDDSLSYMELLARVTKRLNELIENNNKLPDYIMELIKEYISSGEIEKVLAEVLANYMLNVKFPPAGLTPATGDGSADDTEAIQGCIDYAYNNGGMSVYFPSGSYLTQPLTLRDKATLFGQDRYTTRLVMKGGATTAMFTGDVDELTLTGLGFDGNMDIQVNNVNLFTISVNSAIITNCLLTDGYDLLNITVNDDLQLNDVIFRHAVENALVLKGAGIVQGNNLIFKSVSTLVGKNFVVMDVSKSILEQLKCYGASPNAVLINGSNNVVKIWNEQSLKAYTDNGVNNTVEVYTQSEQKKLTGFKTTNVSGDLTETVGGNKTETITGNKGVSVYDLTETVTGNHTKSANNYKAVIQLAYELSANSLTEQLVSKEVNATNSTENLGNKTETITGDKTLTASDISETAANKTIHLTEDKIENIEGDYTETIAGNKTINANNIILNPNNPLTYAKERINLNNFFSYVPFKDNSESYKVLTANEEFLNFFNFPYTNVKYFGAKGDGLTDDTLAIKNALDSIPKGGCLWFPNGTYLISETIKPINVELLLDGFAILKANSDINVVELTPNSRISGGKIDTTFTNFNSSAIYLNGVNQFGWTENPTKCIIDNIQLIGNYSGKGIYFNAKVGDERSFIQGMFVSNVKINMYGTAIHLNPEKGGSVDLNPTWCNGNTFDNIWIEGCRKCIVLTNDYVPNECAGNIFNNIMVQPYAYYTESVFECNGYLNKLNAFIWDWGKNQQTAFILNGDSNAITTNLNTINYGYFIDRGRNNKFISSDNYNYIVPNGTRTRMMCGDQDDYLFKADKRFSITANNVTNIENAFNTNGGLYATVQPNTPVSIIIDLSKKPLLDAQYVGLIFAYSGVSEGITIEIFYDGSYKTIYNVTNFKEQFAIIPIEGVSSIEYIRISLSSKNIIYLSRIFAQSTYYGGVTFLQDYGATYNGDLHFSKENGITMEDTSSGTYYKLYVESGELKIKAL